jgi:hypothetical protein
VEQCDLFFICENDTILSCDWKPVDESILVDQIAINNVFYKVENSQFKLFTKLLLQKKQLL